MIQAFSSNCLQVESMHLTVYLATLTTTLVTSPFWIAITSEPIGLLHASYVVTMTIPWLAGNNIDTKEPPR